MLPPGAQLLAAWLGLGLLALLFLANAFGIVDQDRAAQELAGAGLPGWLVPRPAMLVGAGRLLQLGAAPALLFAPTRPYAALALVAFVASATLAAHAFWRASQDERGEQLANFLKNGAVIGGLLLAAGWRTPT